MPVKITEEIAAPMAVRDLMSAMLSLSELPPALVRLEYEDIELVHARLERLLSTIRENCHAA